MLTQTNLSGSLPAEITHGKYSKIKRQREREFDKPSRMLLLSKAFFHRAISVFCSSMLNEKYFTIKMSISVSRTNFTRARVKIPRKKIKLQGKFNVLVKMN